MKMSYIVCKYCYTIVPQPYAKYLPLDDEETFGKLLERVRNDRVTCTICGGHKWIRKVSSKL